MYCPNCAKEIADDAVVCVGCGRPVTPVSQLNAPDVSLAVGAKNVHDTARAFLVIGILNIITGFISIGVGWIFGIFAVIVGIIELVNAYRYWPTPPRSSSNPTFLPILEMISALCGTLWSLFAGINNRQKLGAPETKAYFAALKSGQPVVLETLSAASTPGSVSSPLAASSTKRCPSCANNIPLQAKICQYCRQEFNEEQIQETVKIFEANVAQNQAAADQKRLVNRGKTLRVIGVILAVIGVLILLVTILTQISSTSAQENSAGFLTVLFVCPVPMIIAGGGLFYWGFSILRKQNEPKLPQPGMVQ